MKPATQQRGFSLVELLVVVGIIALLIGLLLPVITKAWRNSRATACAATLRGIGVGWTLYCQSSPNAFPPAVSFPAIPPPPPTGQMTIMSTLNRQVPSASVWRCPSDDRGYFERFATSYEYWPGILIALNPDNARVLAQYAKHHASEVPILGDAEPFHPKPGDPLRKLALYHDGHVDDFKTP
jgi:prepilin-type N-terminal cleavage/methylation domain-containing protein